VPARFSVVGSTGTIGASDGLRRYYEPRRLLARVATKSTRRSPKFYNVSHTFNDFSSHVPIRSKSNTFSHLLVNEKKATQKIPILRLVKDETLHSHFISVLRPQTPEVGAGDSDRPCSGDSLASGGSGRPIAYTRYAPFALRVIGLAGPHSCQRPASCFWSSNLRTTNPGNHFLS
jgi:hypothetical protein